MLVILLILAGLEIFLRVLEFGPYQFKNESREQRKVYQSAHMPDGREVYYSEGGDITQGPTIDRIKPELEDTPGEKFRGVPFDTGKVEPVVFLHNKPDNVKRVFIVGSSPVWGGPGLAAANLSTHMYNELKHINHHREVEIINAAHHQLDMKGMARLLREVGDYSPDLVLTYIAGVYPNVVLDTIHLISLEQHPLLFRIRQALSGLEIYHLGFNIMAHSSRKMNFKKITAVYDKPEIFNPNARNVLVNYQRILQEMFQVMLDELHKSISEKNIPVAFLGLVTNLSDSPPFASIHVLELNEKELQRFSAHFKTGQRLYEEGNYYDALPELEAAYVIDHTYAMNSYFLGKCRLILGDKSGAVDALKNARDFDGSPERMRSEPTQTLYEWCGRHRIPHIGLNQQLAVASENGVPGKDLFKDVIHPNEAGLAVMGKTVVDWLQDEKKWFARPDEQTAQTALQ